MFCTSYRPGYSLPWLAGAGGRKQVSVGIKHASGHFLLRSNHWGAIGSWVPGQFLNAYASAQLSSALQPSPAPRSTLAAVATGCTTQRRLKLLVLRGNVPKYRFLILLIKKKDRLCRCTLCLLVRRPAHTVHAGGY